MGSGPLVQCIMAHSKLLSGFILLWAASKFRTQAEAGASPTLPIKRDMQVDLHAQTHNCRIPVAVPLHLCKLGCIECDSSMYWILYSGRNAEKFVFCNSINITVILTNL